MEELTYLGVPLKRPRTAVFDFTSCEGCELELLNREETLTDFLNLLEIVNYREASSHRSSDYEVALVEGSITSKGEVERLKAIRAQAGVLAALGSCACFGGINALKNIMPNKPKQPEDPRSAQGGESLPSMGIDAFVPVDLYIYGCPVRKEEVERLVLDVVLGVKPRVPDYPVCMECRAAGHLCLLQTGSPCTGPVTRAGCGAWCPEGARGCTGCRGPCESPNMAGLAQVYRSKGFSLTGLRKTLETFGGFRDFPQSILTG